MAPPLRLLGPGAKPEDRLAAIEAALRQTWSLANSSLQIGPNQKSPVPGELIAGRITSPLPAGQPSMTLDLIQTAPGMGPVLTVNDGTYKRVQTGNLAAYTGPNGIASPAEYGLRVLDQFGNVLFDSINGSGIFTSTTGGGTVQIHSSGALGTWSTANQTTFTAIANTSVTAGTYTRGGPFLLVGALTAKVTAGVGFAYGRIFLNGVDATTGTGLDVIFDSATTGYVTRTQMVLATLPAGNSTLQWYGATEANTITGSANSFGLDAIPITSVSY